jgi:hypothetical protein
VSSSRAVVAAIEQRTRQIVGSLGDLGERALRAPSRLDGWSRLTIACHLRYGAEALALMTRHVGALDGDDTASNKLIDTTLGTTRDRIVLRPRQDSNLRTRLRSSRAGRSHDLRCCDLAAWLLAGA